MVATFFRRVKYNECDHDPKSDTWLKYSGFRNISVELKVKWIRNETFRKKSDIREAADFFRLRCFRSKIFFSTSRSPFGFSSDGSAPFEQTTVCSETPRYIFQAKICQSLRYWALCLAAWSGTNSYLLLRYASWMHLSRQLKTFDKMTKRNGTLG